MTSHGQIAHIWAQQTKQHATGSRMFFEGRNIYSHGRHFLIAAHIENKKGDNAILFTTDHYSHTTTRHKGYTRNAIANDTLVFNVPLYGLSIQSIDTRWKELHAKDFWKYYKSKVKELETETKKATKRFEWPYKDYLQTVQEANRFAAFAGLKSRLKASEGLAAIVEAKKQRLSELEAQKNSPEVIAKREKDKQRREALRQRKRQEEVYQWMTGELRSIHWERGDPVYMRIQGDKIQTSQGAEFPIPHGLKAFEFIKQCKEKEQEWETNGKSIHLGNFTIDKIEPSGNVKAGCHYVAYAEIERVAKLLKAA
jgi:hypothetical protein